MVTNPIMGKITLYLLVKSTERGGGAIRDYKGDDPEKYKGSWYGYSIMAPGDYMKGDRYDIARFLYHNITKDVIFEMSKCPGLFTCRELDYLMMVYNGDDNKQLRQMLHIRHTYQARVEATA